MLKPRQLSIIFLLTVYCKIDLQFNNHGKIFLTKYEDQNITKTKKCSRNFLIKKMFQAIGSISLIILLYTHWTTLR